MRAEAGRQPLPVNPVSDQRGEPDAGEADPLRDPGPPNPGPEPQPAGRGEVPRADTGDNDGPYVPL